MRRHPGIRGRTLALAGVLLPLLALFGYVGLRTGPMAAVPVTVVTVESRAIAPALFGIGTVEARYTYKIGPTVAGRVGRVDVQVGDRVRAGQILGEMAPVDLDQRVEALAAAQRRAEASALAAEAQVADTAARRDFAEGQARRYERLLQANAVSAEMVETRRQELQVAEAGYLSAQAGLRAARQEQERIMAERRGLVRQRTDLRLVSPVVGLVSARDAEPGTTVVAGQSVVQVIDPASVWVHARFDQLRASGLRAGLPARVTLRSRGGQSLAGHVYRVEPLADAVTEEMLAKVVLDAPPSELPPIGELAEVTVVLPALPPAPVVPNASIQRVHGRLGVWVIGNGRPSFVPVRTAGSDLDGRVRVVEGLAAGARVVEHSQRALEPGSRIRVVERIPGTAS